MRVLMVMFDSLNRDMLEPYGGNLVKTPNFTRMAEHSVTFDNCYAGSLPCMPARRELHTGRYNFLHRSWGPLEPFDDSMPEILNHHHIHSHLATDHYHHLALKASDCIVCHHCDKRCPFHVQQSKRMQEITDYFHE